MDIVFFKQVLLLMLIMVAVAIDWRTTKIPNLLTFPGALGGVILNYIAADWQGALMACAGWFIAALVTVFLGNLPLGPGTRVSGIGMGDAKLLAMVGAFWGKKCSSDCFIFLPFLWSFVLDRAGYKNTLETGESIGHHSYY